MKIHGRLSRLALVLIASIAQTSFAAEYLVKYRSPFALQSLNSARVKVMDVHAKGNLAKVVIDERQKIQSFLDLYSNTNVEYVVPNFKLRRFEAPIEVQNLRQQYAMVKVRAEEAWRIAGNRGNKNVIVAVIDTGVDYRHQALSPNMVPGYDFAKNDNDPMDETGFQNPGHGTHCAGVIGATGLVAGGIVGLSPEVSLMPIRFLDERGSGDLNNGIKAIDFAIEKGAKVISASWGAAVPRSEALPLIEAIERAEKAGVVFVAAAANDGKNNDTYEVYPTNAGISNMISVAASNERDQKPSWSNFGRGKVHLASPGENIISTVPGNRYSEMSGTSMATPLVAGLTALMLAQDPTLTAPQIRAIMQATGAQVGIPTACDCRIDAAAAVTAIKNKQMTVVPHAGTMAKGSTMNVSAVYGTAPFQFSSSNPNVASVDANGVITAIAEGDTQITVTDARGTTATSYKYYVGQPAGTPPGNPGQPGQPGEPGDCPLGDPSFCEILCGIQPDLPFCQK